MSRDQSQHYNERIGWTKAEFEEALSKVKQPYYDFEIAKICQWLKKHKYKCFVSINGQVSLERRPK